MEMVMAIAIGVMAGCGVWLLLRPRTFQVIMGLSLLSYASTCSSSASAAWPWTASPCSARPARPANYTDPMPQALVLTAIVIGFAMTALFLVVLLALARPVGHRPCGRPGGTPYEDRAARRADAAPDASRPRAAAAGHRGADAAAGRRPARTKAVVNLLSTAQPGLAVAVLPAAGRGRRAMRRPAFGVYLPGNWPVPFGIVLVLTGCRP
jgi:multicomponent K+:H+ antiporter subunit C